MAKAFWKTTKCLPMLSREYRFARGAILCCVATAFTMGKPVAFIYMRMAKAFWKTTKFLPMLSRKYRFTRGAILRCAVIASTMGNKPGFLYTKTAEGCCRTTRFLPMPSRAWRLETVAVPLCGGTAFQETAITESMSTIMAADPSKTTTCAAMEKEDGGF